MSSVPLEPNGEVSESSSKPDFQSQENQLRKVANRRLLKLLKDENAEVPAGQLMAFVAKVGFRVEPERQEKTQIQTQNVLAILGGLPPERAEEILTGYQKQIDNARKELTNGG